MIKRLALGIAVLLAGIGLCSGTSADTLRIGSKRFTESMANAS